jgi:hypothetical protein
MPNGDVIRDLVRASNDLEKAARRAEGAILEAFRRAEQKMFERVAVLLSEAPRFDAVNLQRRLAWYFENIPSTEIATAQAGYFKAVRSYLDKYPSLAGFVERVLEAGRVPKDLTTIPKEIIEMLRREDLSFFEGLNTEAMRRLDRQLLDSVIIGRTPAGALEDIRGTITGSYKWGKRRGLYEWHAGTYARTAGMRFSRMVTKAKADELQLEHFVYIGPADSKVRPFCADILGGAFTSLEIEDMDNGQTGDVMSDGGGFNCRHTWSPVDKSIFNELRKAEGQEAVKEEIEKQAPGKISAKRKR